MTPESSAPAKSGDPVLIAAFSGRALAQSAHRAGYLPLVIDCFGDQDMRSAAYAAFCLPARVQVGFKKKSLLSALDTLAQQSPRSPLGLVLGTGFECNPSLVSVLGERFSLLGNSAHTIQRVKDPILFFETLTRLHIRHPETQLIYPRSAEGWLIKRRGGSGGLHIHPCPQNYKKDKRKYFQKVEKGKSLSLFAIASSSGIAFAFSEQWTSPTPRRPYRYGGSVSGIHLDSNLEARLIDAAHSVIQEFQLKGMISLDFILQDGEFLLLEVNPRPGATVDIFDDDKGSLFRAHHLAMGGENPSVLLQDVWKSKEPTSTAYLYADRGSLKIPKIEWPKWVSDRPAESLTINQGQPIATVRADGSSPEEAKALCLERLNHLDTILYEHSNKG